MMKRGASPTGICLLRAALKYPCLLLFGVLGMPPRLLNAPMAEAMVGRCGRLSMQEPRSARLDSRDNKHPTYGAVFVTTSRKDFHEASGIVALWKSDCQRKSSAAKLVGRKKVRDIRVWITCLHKASNHLQLQHMIHVKGGPLSLAYCLGRDSRFRIPSPKWLVAAKCRARGDCIPCWDLVGLEMRAVAVV